MSSTRGPVRKALKALWSDTFAALDVQVSYPRAGASTGRRILIGDAVGNSAAEALGPQRSMEEDYTIDCVVAVTEGGAVDDQEAITDECEALFTAAELAVRSSPSQTLGVVGVLWAVVDGPWSLREATASETGGPINATVEFQVHVRARYQLT